MTRPLRGAAPAACLAAALLAVALLPTPALGGPLGDDVEAQCLAAGAPAAACGAARAVFEGLKRPGASASDFRGEPVARVEIADFYFAGKLTLVREDQRVVWQSLSPPGGNSHSVSSSDWNAEAEAVLPAPGLDFGGGAGFRSGQLRPGDTFQFVMDLNTLHPDARIVLPGGDALVAYHCYIHGAGVMQALVYIDR